ncbi:MAG: hypothetical protein ACOCUD_01740 [Bacillota bacterium]
MKEIPQIGQIESIIQVVGWKVCEETSEKEEQQKWIPVEKYWEAKVLSESLKK